MPVLCACARFCVHREDIEVWTKDHLNLAEGAQKEGKFQEKNLKSGALLR